MKIRIACGSVEHRLFRFLQNLPDRDAVSILKSEWANLCWALFPGQQKAQSAFYYNLQIIVKSYFMKHVIACKFFSCFASTFKRKLIHTMADIIGSVRRICLVITNFMPKIFSYFVLKYD